MKKLLFAVACCCLALTGVSAQENAAGDVTLEMADGITVRGYAHTEMVNNVEFFEISAEPEGERTRYDSYQIMRIVFDDGTVYVPKLLVDTVRGTTPKLGWVRVDYLGDGITLYSAYFDGWEPASKINYTNRKVKQRNYYIALGADNAVCVSNQYLTGNLLNNAGAANGKELTYYFRKRYPQYADLARRIKAKEFDTSSSPIEVVKAWEEAYGGK